MVFLWLSFGFTIVFSWFSLLPYGFPVQVPNLSSQIQNPVHDFDTHAGRDAGSRALPCHRASKSYVWIAFRYSFLTVFTWSPCGFLLVILCFPFGVNMFCFWYSCCFPIAFLHLSYGCPIVSNGIPMVLLMVSQLFPDGFSMVHLLFCLCFSMVGAWFSYGSKQQDGHGGLISKTIRNRRKMTGNFVY